MKVDTVYKVGEGRPDIVDLIKNNEINFVINTVSDAKAQRDSFSIRESALRQGVPYTTTLSGAKAAVNAIEVVLKEDLNIRSLQEHHNDISELRSRN